jgi:hypothetical protein
MNDILYSFPKIRDPLPPAFAAVYAQHYKENRDGSSSASGLAQTMERWMHRRVAADVLSGAAKSTLEIGAGTLNHLDFEIASTPYDIVEPFRFLYETSYGFARVRNVYEDIADIPVETKYERILSIATFEHICNLPEVVARCGLLLAQGGQLRIGIPSEGTVLWYLGWKLTTGLEFKLKHNLDYGVLMKYEHVNTAKEIEAVLRHFFVNIERRVFGVSTSLSFYQFYSCSMPHADRCARYLSQPFQQ